MLHVEEGSSVCRVDAVASTTEYQVVTMLSIATAALCWVPVFSVKLLDLEGEAISIAPADITLIGNSSVTMVVGVEAHGSEDGPIIDLEVTKAVFQSETVCGGELLTCERFPAMIVVGVEALRCEDRSLLDVDDIKAVFQVEKFCGRASSTKAHDFTKPAVAVKVDSLCRGNGSLLEGNFTELPASQ